jgi:CO dehydrogenase maturation factor
VVNKITPETKPLLAKAARENGIDIMAYIPFDPAVAQFDILGKPITELPPDSPFSLAMDEICGKILQRLDLFVQAKP